MHMIVNYKHIVEVRENNETFQHSLISEKKLTYNKLNVIPVGHATLSRLFRCAYKIPLNAEILNYLMMHTYHYHISV